MLLIFSIRFRIDGEEQDGIGQGRGGWTMDKDGDSDGWLDFHYISEGGFLSANP